MRHGYLERILSNLSAQQGPKELIAVVSPCTDDTLGVLRQYPQWRILETDAQNRAQRLNAGIYASSGEIVLLHHPATLLPERIALAQIEALMVDAEVVWGGFHHSFDLDHWLLRFTSWYSSRVRSHYSHILYLDHCIFARRSLLEKIGGLPDMDIFEDTVLSQQLSQFGAPVLLPEKIVTSARRFRQRGIYRQALLNQLLKGMYHARLDPSWMNWLYERQSQINVAYKDQSQKIEIKPSEKKG
ncbi:MAG: glycosyl transferase [Cyanobacteria bacterium Co-bin13]|nr:glycosyl transferase [Cyanobacteria bacterium Co-bin13]